MAGAKQTDSRPIRTGIKEFDDLTSGLPPGSLTVLSGQWKSGKTTLAMNLAEEAALEQGRPVLYLVQRLSAPFADCLLPGSGGLPGLLRTETHRRERETVQCCGARNWPFGPNDR